MKVYAVMVADPWQFYDVEDSQCLPWAYKIHGLYKNKGVTLNN